MTTTTAPEAKAPTVADRERQIRHAVEYVNDAPDDLRDSFELALHLILSHSLGLPSVRPSRGDELLESYREREAATDGPDADWSFWNNRFTDLVFALAVESTSAARTAEVVQLPCERGA